MKTITISRQTVQAQATKEMLIQQVFLYEKQKDLFLIRKICPAVQRFVNPCKIRADFRKSYTTLFFGNLQEGIKSMKLFCVILHKRAIYWKFNMN